MKYLSVWLLLAVFAAISAENTRLKEVFSWKTVEFKFPKDSDRADAIRDKTFIPDNNLPLGLDVWRDKLFITVPRWKAGVVSSLNYVDISDVEIPEPSDEEPPEEEEPPPEEPPEDPEDEEEPPEDPDDVEEPPEEPEDPDEEEVEPTEEPDVEEPEDPAEIEEPSEETEDIEEPPEEPEEEEEPSEEEGALEGALDPVTDLVGGDEGLLGEDGLVAGVGDLVTGDDGLLGEDGLVGGLVTGDDGLLGEDGLVGGLVTGDDGLLGEDGLVGGLVTGDDGLLGEDGLVGGLLTGDDGLLGEDGLVGGLVTGDDGLLGEDGLVGGLVTGDDGLLGEDGLVGGLVTGDDGLLGEDGLVGGLVTGDDGLLGEDGLVGGLVGDDADDDDEDGDDEDGGLLDDVTGALPGPVSDLVEGATDPVTDLVGGGEDGDGLLDDVTGALPEPVSDLVDGATDPVTDLVDGGDASGDDDEDDDEDEDEDDDEEESSEEESSEEEIGRTHRSLNLGLTKYGSLGNGTKCEGEACGIQRISKGKKTTSVKKSKAKSKRTPEESTKTSTGKSKKKPKKDRKPEAIAPARQNKKPSTESEKKKTQEVVKKEKVKTEKPKKSSKKEKKKKQVAETDENLQNCRDAEGNPCGIPVPAPVYFEPSTKPPKNPEKKKEKPKKSKKKKNCQKAKKPKKPKKPKKDCVKPAKVSATSPALIPYPSLDENTPAKDKDCITSVFRVRVDPCDRLWVMDTGVSDILGAFEVYSKPQILVYDLLTDKLVKKYVFQDKDVQENSFFANIVVDVDKDKCDDAFAYVPDLGSYAIVVYDMKKDKAWRIKHHYFHFNPLEGNYNVGGVNFQWTDGVFGIALTRPNPDGSKTAYFHALSSYSQFKTETPVLQDEKEGEKSNYTAYSYVGNKGENSQTSASFIHESTGVMFYTQVNKDAVYCWNTDKPFSQENLEEVASDSTTMVFPNDLKVDYKNNLWVLTDKLPVFVTQGLDPKEINYRIFVAPVAEAIKDTNCVP